MLVGDMPPSSGPCWCRFCKGGGRHLGSRQIQRHFRTNGGMDDVQRRAMVAAREEEVRRSHDATGPVDLRARLLHATGTATSTGRVIRPGHPYERPPPRILTLSERQANATRAADRAASARRSAAAERTGGTSGSGRGRQAERQAAGRGPGAAHQNPVSSLWERQAKRARQVRARAAAVAQAATANAARDDGDANEGRHRDLEEEEDEVDQAVTWKEALAEHIQGNYRMFPYVSPCFLVFVQVK